VPVDEDGGAQRGGERRQGDVEQREGRAVAEAEQSLKQEDRADGGDGAQQRCQEEQLPAHRRSLILGWPGEV